MTVDLRRTGLAVTRANACNTYWPWVREPPFQSCPLLRSRRRHPKSRSMRIRTDLPLPWVEHDPEEIRASQMGVAVEALSRANGRPRDIAALGIANQR